MRAEARALGALALAVLAIHLALAQPDHPDAATWGAVAALPLELPVILIALALARGRTATRLRVAITAFLAAMAALKAADLASALALGRPFNPALDLHLAAAGWNVARGSLGAPLALAAAAALALALAAATWALWRATGRIAALDPPPPARAALLALLVPAIAVAALDAARELSPLDPPGAALTTRLAWEHARDAARARAELGAFRAAAAADPAAALPPEAVLPALRGRDVLVVFVESWGRATLERPPFAAATAPALAAAETRLAAAGLAMRSGWLASPTIGGRSWLAHATLLAGLRIDDQGRYRALVASPHAALPRLARGAGWRAVAAMPAITLAWPEGAWFGYDRVLAAADLGYAGPPFNWVTMPDQFALAAFERAELDPPGRPPVLAVVALISSHAPWTPIPPRLPWDALGDGAVFAPHAAAGPTPEALWRDLDAVRDHLGQTLAYSLATATDFVARRAEAGAAPLALIVGDHPPAGFLTGDPDGRETPAHLVGPPEALARLDDWGWTPGLVPAADAPVWPMEAFRDRLLAAFGPAGGAQCPGARTLPDAIGC